MKLFKCPFSNGSLGKNIGCKNAPDKIIEQIKDLYLSESGRLPNFDIKDIPVDQSDIEETNKSILEIINQESFSDRTCIIGGDHSITYSGLKAFKRKHPGAGIIILDAHPDCESQTSPPSHEDYLRALIGDGILNPKELILVGLRNWTGNEKAFLDNRNIRYYTMKQIMIQGLVEVTDSVTEIARSWPAIYLSVDIDAADPSCAPGTGYIEPGGLTGRELLYVIQRLALLSNLKCIDLVEVNPEKDFNNMTSKLAAKILVELV